LNFQNFRAAEAGDDQSAHRGNCSLATTFEPRVSSKRSFVLSIGI
jgi:hypothetical protein